MAANPMRQSGRHDAISNSCVNSKIKRRPGQTTVTSCSYTTVFYRFVIATASGLALRSLGERCAPENPAESLPNSLLLEALNRLTVTEPILAKHACSWEIS